MTGLDVALAGVVVLSTLAAMLRGLVREFVSLAAWCIGLAMALAFSDEFARRLAFLDAPLLARELLAFALIVVAALVAGALVGALLRGAVNAVGLGSLDRLLGALFGLARGLVAVLVFALIAGLTSLPQRDWWQNSMFGPMLGVAALSLRPYLPSSWASRLDFPFPPPAPAGHRRTAIEAPTGANDPCAES